MTAMFSPWRTVRGSFVASLFFVAAIDAVAAGDGTPFPPRPAFGLSSVLIAKVADYEAAVRRAPESAEVWANLGMLYQANGFTQPAIESYDAAIARSSAPNPKLHYLRGVAAEMEGASERAEADFRKTLQQQPAFMPAWLRLAELRYKSGDAAAASANYKKALSIDPDCPEALLALARDELRQRNDLAALNLLERLEASHPEYGSGSSLKAQILERRGQRTEAERVRQRGRTRKDPPMKDPQVDEMMRHCVDVQQLGVRFEDQLNAGMTADALATLDRMEAIDPQNWQTYRLRGFTYAHAGKPKEAEIEYRKAMQHGGDPAMLYPALVAALMKRDQTEEAERVANEGLKITPSNGALLVALAEMKLTQKRPPDAEALLDRALMADDRDLTARRMLSRLKWESGGQQEAIHHFMTIVQLDPTELPARVLIAQHHLENGEPANAIELLTQARALAPEDSDVRHLLALALLRTGNQLARDGKVDAALVKFNEATEVEPSSIEAQFNKAKLLAHAGRLAEAKASAEGLLNVQPNEAAAHLLLGDIERALTGSNEHARAHWNRAAELLSSRADSDPLKRTVASRLR